jgi:AraC family transcriptional regulator
MPAAIEHQVRDPLAAALARKAGNGEPGRIEARLLAAGHAWQAYDIVCSCGPRDRPFEERHATASISLVLSGTFACRSQSGVCLLSPGAWFLVNAGAPIECSHQHGEGDRCLSFQFDAEVFARLAHEAGAARHPFARQSLPPLRAHAPLVARALRAMERSEPAEEIAFEVAGSIIRAATGSGREMCLSRHHAVVARVVRQLSSATASPHTLANLAGAANMSPYHFLRTFKSITGVTPHQWLLRARLRDAAKRLANSRAPITAIALDVGFEDLSNFIRSFRAEFGLSPRQYRAAA